MTVRLLWVKEKPGEKPGFFVAILFASMGDQNSAGMALTCLAVKTGPSLQT
jgi:hypothetical protein